MRIIPHDSALVALLSPKTALLFAAFLPQFIDPAGSGVAQRVLFDAAFVAVAGRTDTACVRATGVAAPALAKLTRANAAGRHLAAAICIGLGLFTPASGSRGAR